MTQAITAMLDLAVCVLAACEPDSSTGKNPSSDQIHNSGQTYRTY